MEEIWDKLHIELGSTVKKAVKCGEFQTLKFIKVISIDTSCGCTKANFKDNKNV